ncbi:MAG TPA: Rho termination factor N-terminal domain-containing protein [Solirubrobacteraceae bacterium]|jgi:transcription termination factor Rho|nr:Rho termination factor N-terminal domain-containing protein [Solirubrobacteraceae bacterium]
MTVLDRSELEASSLADLHQIADQVGLEGFRRLRKADLIDALLGERTEGASEDGERQDAERGTRRRRPLRPRSRRARTPEPDEDGGEEDEAVEPPAEALEDEQPAPRRRRGRGTRTAGEGSRSAGGRSGGGDAGERTTAEREPESLREGVVEILGNGSALLRVHPPEPSDEDVYVSAAQVRRCELVPGDRVAGPVRAPRRSERHPSLVRVETINGAPAESVAEGTRYEELAVSYPSEHLTFGSEDPTLKAIEWLTPLGRGSRAVIAGPPRSGKTEALVRIADALAGREDLQLSLVLAGARPEEIAKWRGGTVQPAAAVSFAAGPDAQAQAVEAAVETAKRMAARGADAVVLIDGLGDLPLQAARRALAAARKLEQGGSLTVIATAPAPVGGETTVIALDPVLAGSGKFPAIDLVRSGTLRPELLVGEDGAEAIARARASASDG